MQDAIDALETLPFPTGYKKLQGRGSFRIRVGRYRVVYTVDQGQLVIGIFTLGPRGGVNKK
ncbi:toxin-antitoxin system, toxin component, RelE domain protein [Corynebacterium sp. CMW7794]|uniref:type II toxin-antitoxin system RelE family toxin n=1 Tax=Corynebacterium sp. CMW7794 TaxID=1603887 RepID=UPI00079C502F|nr:type II toxin-antitoxin system RelE/ParE family toxin [Corynebacterium sp. CMW7794]KXI18456.1 toxin-antitoxin system, toxin component, RelE domain protein [Corynebacterium sp. CMW7794]